MSAAHLAERPLHATAARVGAVRGWLPVHGELPPDTTRWTRCTEVDGAFLAGWEARIAASLVRSYGRSDPHTVSGYALDWYAGVAGHVGGAFFRVARRVPRLDRAALAFSSHPTEHYPDELAVLDDRFWCLPDDPDAGHPAATPVEDEQALAAVLRAQVRGHADAFLAGFRPGARLPRRGLLGAFFDALDTGIWYGGDPTPAAAGEVLADTALALPGGTAEFADGSTVHALVDGRGREHLSRRRVGCCYHFKVAPGGTPCHTCPRLDDAERLRAHTELDLP